MTDQLSLSLEDGRPRLPATLRPMLPGAESAPFDSADHLFEPIWGGERALALVETEPDGRRAVRLLDRRGRPLHVPPEVEDVARRVTAASAILDGELVAVGVDGRLDPSGLRARLRGDTGPALAFLVSDVLYVDGRALLGVALERRRDALRRAVAPGGALVAVPAVAADGIALHAAVVAQGLRGVMARERRSPYLPGVRSRLWRFVPAVPDGARAVDAGARPEGGPPEASGPPGPSPTPAWPIVALIQRLPFPEDE